jgi:hypothetical protein
LIWRRPRNTDEKAPLLKRKSTQIHVSLKTGKIEASSYREMIGSSSSDWRGCEFVERGQVPGLEGILHGVAIDRSGEARLLTRDSRADTRSVDLSGLIDVFILKALRLFRVGIGRGIKMVRNDEITFAFDREGRIAYIASSCQSFPGHPLDAQHGGHLLGWAERYGPSTWARRSGNLWKDVAR